MEIPPSGIRTIIGGKLCNGTLKIEAILQGLGVGSGSATECWPLDIPSSYTKIWRETNFQPWEFPRSR